MKKLISVLLTCILLTTFAGTLPAEGIRIPEKGSTAAPGSIIVFEGWNLISLPCYRKNDYTVKQLVEDIELSPPGQDWEVLAVTVYKQGKYLDLLQEASTYNMVPQEAYFVYVRYDGPRPPYGKPMVGENGEKIYPLFRPNKTILISGEEVEISVSFNLNKGWNGVSLLSQKFIGSLIQDPPTPDLDDVRVLHNLASLGMLSRGLAQQGVRATQVAFWNARDQKWEIHSLPFSGNIGDLVCNRLIMPGEGFFLFTEENGLYQPGLELPKPPGPEEVIHVGRIQEKELVGIGTNPYSFYMMVPAEPMLPAELELGLVSNDKEINILLWQAARDGSYTWEVRGYMETITIGKDATMDVLRVHSVRYILPSL